MAPPECVDDESIDDPVVVLNDAIEHRIGSGPDREGYWPLEPQSWTEAEFYDLVEVVHDLVSRPRYGTYHSYGNCGWHYSEFAVDPAQILYRWAVNRIFERCALPLRLAKTGEDTGRLVQVAGDDRDRLAEMAVEHTTGADTDLIAHAIALYRSRDSGREAKRSACVALFGILETHRDLLKAELLSKDEGALFTIANNFQVRHRRADQHGEYDDAFLDWIFWGTLATVELTNQLLQRQDMAP